MRTEPPPAAVQRTLILLTKPLLNLAFQVEADEMKEAYLAPMRDFLVDNKNGMADFLASCSVRPTRPVILTGANCCTMSD